jgi:hypothetical protein
MLCGFTHGENLFIDTVKIINLNDKQFKLDVEHKLSEGLINTLDILINEIYPYPSNL